MKLYWNILDQTRKDLLLLLAKLKGFYLAGGTALAIYLGHRNSYDFDFFTREDFDPAKLFTELKILLKNHQLKRTQLDVNTISILADNVRISFFTHDYALIEATNKNAYFPLASKLDIACMKLNAIVNRATQKDYVDLYFLLQEIGLPELLAACKKKYTDLDIMLVLKSLVYTADIVPDKLRFRRGFKVNLEDATIFISSEVKKYQLSKFKS